MRGERIRRTQQLLHAAQDAGPREREDLLAQVVETNLCVAEAIARRYRDRGVEIDDLIQVAREGLVLAVRRFDTSRSDDLLTFAVPTIRGSVTRYFRDHGWAVRPPRGIQQLQWQMVRTADQLRLELGREPTRAEVAGALGVETEELARAEGAFGSFRPMSLDQSVSDDASLAVGDAVATTEDNTDAVDARTILAPHVQRLAPRDRRIVYLRFFEERTQSEIGDEIGVTQMQVSRLLARILQDLRTGIEAA